VAKVRLSDHLPSTDIGVIIAAILIWKLESPSRFYADPAISLAISLVIFASAVPLSNVLSIIARTPAYLAIQTSNLALRSGRILLEATPLHLDLSKIKDDLTTVIFSFAFISCQRNHPENALLVTFGKFSARPTRVALVTVVRTTLPFNFGRG
jgi:Co/Zn/Cd efflux system component